MNIEKKTENGEIQLIVKGCLDTAATSEFVHAVDEAAAQTKTLVFDFTGLEFIASSALRKLVSVDKALTALGGKIVIAGMSDIVREVFDITGLNEVFATR